MILIITNEHDISTHKVIDWLYQQKKMIFPSVKIVNLDICVRIAEFLLGKE
jgi:hypothetical protein